MSNNNNNNSIQCKWPFKTCHNRTRKTPLCYDHLKEFGFEIRPSNIINSEGKSVGEGLFAVREFEDGETIDYYHGKVYPWSNQVNIPDNDYLLSVRKKGIIDGSNPTSCISRYINHTSKKFINCELSPESEGNGQSLRIPVITTKRVHINEEFYTTYGNSFFDKGFQLYDPPIEPGIPNPVMKNNTNNNNKKRKHSETEEEESKKWFIDLLMEAEAEIKQEKLKRQQSILKQYSDKQNKWLAENKETESEESFYNPNKTKSNNKRYNLYEEAVRKSKSLVKQNEANNNSNSYDSNLDPLFLEIDYNHIKNNRALCRNCHLVKTKPYFAPFHCGHCTTCLPCVQKLRTSQCPICKKPVTLNWKKEHHVTADDNKYKTNDGTTSIL